MITFTRTAAALAFAAFLAPGVSVAATDQCYQDANTASVSKFRACLRASGVVPHTDCSQSRTMDEHLYCVLPLVASDDTKGTNAALDRYFSKLARMARKHPGDSLAMGGPHRHGMSEISAILQNRAAIDVVDLGEIAKLPLWPYANAQLAACAKSGLSFSYFVQSRGCLEPDYEDDKKLLYGAGNLLAVAERLATTPDLAARVRQDYLAAMHMLAVTRPGLAGIVTIPSQPAIKAGSEALRAYAAGGLSDIQGYTDNLRREAAGRPVNDWRGPASGAK